MLEVAAAWPCDPIPLLSAEYAVIVTMIDILTKRAEEAERSV